MAKKTVKELVDALDELFHQRDYSKQVAQKLIAHNIVDLVEERKWYEIRKIDEGEFDSEYKTEQEAKDAFVSGGFKNTEYEIVTVQEVIEDNLPE